MNQDMIAPEEGVTLAGLFQERVKRTPNAPAYRQYDIASKKWGQATWKQMASEIARWQLAFQKEGLVKGDRVAVMLKNCRDWVVFDQAALGLGLVTVPLYTDDRPDNVAYIVADAGVKLLVVEGKLQWKRLQEVGDNLPEVKRIVSVNTIDEDDEPKDKRLEVLSEWLYGLSGEIQNIKDEATALASIVYTSGTTGKPKGVMLSHQNMFENAYAASQVVKVYPTDVFLSFLPLSHTLERSIGYYFPVINGAEVVYARSILQLGEDLQNIKPTIMISVPRIYERVYGKIKVGLEKKSALANKLFNKTIEVGYKMFEHRQGRTNWQFSFLLWPILNKLVAKPVLQKLGGNMRFAVAGGAPLPPQIAKVFLGLGLDVLHGYGLTEASPVICVNRIEDNVPESIGKPITGIEVRIGKNDELQSRSKCVMQGYWNLPDATKETFTEDGWLKTGDKARIDDEGRIFITGRIKEILVLGNGEKMPPADMEMAIALDPLFEQVMVIGEGRAYLSALVTLEPDEWKAYAKSKDLDPKKDASLLDRYIVKDLTRRVTTLTKSFPGFAKIRKVVYYRENWTIDDGLLTPKMSMKRNKIMEHHADDIENILYPDKLA
jgi:long-chain acyl-CoA synthetase